MNIYKHKAVKFAESGIEDGDRFAETGWEKSEKGNQTKVHYIYSTEKDTDKVSRALWEVMNTIISQLMLDLNTVQGI